MSVRRNEMKVAIVEAGRAAITDCVYRVRIPKTFRQAVFLALRSPTGEAQALSSEMPRSGRRGAAASTAAGLPRPMSRCPLRLSALR